MKNPRNSIERFCAQHPNFGIPNLIKYVTIANVAFWLLGAINFAYCIVGYRRASKQK